MPLPHTYLDAVEIETMSFIQKALDGFFQTFDPARRTVVLLPGGLGSTLRQSYFPFNGYPQPPSTFRRVIWVDLGLLFGEALRLPIDTDGFDTGHRIVIAEGDLDYCLVHPYNDAVTYFRDHLNLNVLVLGWDWRRKVMTTVDYLAQTLTEMSSRALNTSGQNILQNTFLVGHSMGGMVAKLLMSCHFNLADELRGMISVGTPFYGYFGQLDRFYNGVKYFNALYTAPAVAQITSSWPGMYSLLPIDQMTYNHSHTALGLTSYPVVDAATGDPVDPYNPSSLPRYPGWVRTNQIPRGLNMRYKLAAPLPGAMGDKVHHLRADEPNTTQTSATWDALLPPGFVPGLSPSPIEFHKGKGDDTIPAWSAALASTSKANIHNFNKKEYGDKYTFEHALLMEERPILAKIAEIITEEAVAPSQVEETLGPRAKVATTKDVDAVVRGIQSGSITRSRPYQGEGKLIIPSDVLRYLMVSYGL